MNKLVKKLTAIVCTATLCFSVLTGCGKDKKEDLSASYSEEVVLKVGEYEVYKDEVMLYCMLELLSGTVTYNNLIFDESIVKNNIISEIRENKVLYDVAMAEGMEFNEDDIETRERLISNFKEYVPKNIREQYGISDELIDRVFEQTTYVDKFENDKKNELGKKLNEEALEEYKDINFQKLYYMVFPIVASDEEGNPAVDDNGDYIPLSEEEKQAVLEDAQAAVEKVNSGEAAATVAEEYNITAYSYENFGYAGIYDEELGSKLENLEEGKATDLIESDICVYSVVIIDNNNQELYENYAYAVARDSLDQEYATLKEQWMSDAGINGDSDFVGTFWKDFVLIEMSKVLKENGLMN